MELRLHSLLNVVLGQIITKECLVWGIGAISGIDSTILNIELSSRDWFSCQLSIATFLRSNPEFVIVLMLRACLTEHAYKLGLDLVGLTYSSRLFTASMDWICALWIKDRFSSFRGLACLGTIISLLMTISDDFRTIDKLMQAGGRLPVNARIECILLGSWPNEPIVWLHAVLRCGWRCCMVDYGRIGGHMIGHVHLLLSPKIAPVMVRLMRISALIVIIIIVTLLTSFFTASIVDGHWLRFIRGSGLSLYGLLCKLNIA